MRVALAQINTTVGDHAGNVSRIVEAARRATGEGAELVLFPELSVVGYPPRDLLDVPDFLDAGLRAVEDLAERTADGPPLLVGSVEPHDQARGLGRYNSALWIENGQVRTRVHKRLLPNYDVFDERRHFDPGPGGDAAVMRGGLRFGVTVCEDLWNDDEYWEHPRYDDDPVADLAATGCDWILNLSASPYHRGKGRQREEMVSALARRHGVGVVLCNLVGGNDSLVFDGASFVVDGRGEVIARAVHGAEDLLLVDLDRDVDKRDPEERLAVLSPEVRHRVGALGLSAAKLHGADGEEPAGEGADDEDADAELPKLLTALELGLRDYVRKTGFRDCLVGLSGGVDSALTLALAARALGPERVMAVSMPSRFTASMSEEDAAALAERLGVRLETIAIEPIFTALTTALSPLFGDREADVTEENLQARIRGTLLMALSNKLGHLVLTTGNKSELAVGYCTLYGDMCGGFNVIGDVEKTAVYDLCRLINRDEEVIPDRILTRAPSAELRDDQRDDDSLPPYPELDALLHALVVEKRGGAALRAESEDPARIDEVRRLLIRSEYKRRQAAPVLKVSPVAFGEGWRFPIAHGWR